MSEAAARFMELVGQVWSGDEYEATASAGCLSDSDEMALDAICQETSDDATEAAAEIVEACRERCNDRKAASTAAE